MFDWRAWDSHTQRWATGAPLGVLVVLVLGLGPPWSLSLLVAAAAGLGLCELHAMMFPEKPPPTDRKLFVGAGFLFPLLTGLHGTAGLHGALFATLCGGFAVVLFRSPQDPAALVRLSRLVLGWLYVPYMLSFALLIGQLEHGRAWLFFSVLLGVANDTAAFYSGRRFGRHKLYQRVSPKKTVEGSLGGLAASLAAGAGFALGYLQTWSVGLLVLSALLAVAGQLGDLVESMLKRMSGIKDSGTFLPGHGGILDRLDALLFIFPLTWLALSWSALTPVKG